VAGMTKLSGEEKNPHQKFAAETTGAEGKQKGLQKQLHYKLNFNGSFDTVMKAQGFCKSYIDQLPF